MQPPPPKISVKGLLRRRSRSPNAFLRMVFEIGFSIPLYYDTLIFVAIDINRIINKYLETVLFVQGVSDHLLCVHRVPFSLGRQGSAEVKVNSNLRRDCQQAINKKRISHP